jgi:hypothetical protein
MLAATARALPRVMVLGFVVSFLAACAATPQASAPETPAVLIAIRMSDSSAPPPELGARIQRALASTITDAGMRPATDLRDATYLITVTYTPDPVNPQGGHLQVGPAEPLSEVRRPASNGEIARIKRLQDDQVRTMDRLAEVGLGRQWFLD